VDKHVYNKYTRTHKPAHACAHVNTHTHTHTHLYSVAPVRSIALPLAHLGCGPHAQVVLNSLALAEKVLHACVCGHALASNRCLLCIPIYKNRTKLYLLTVSGLRKTQPAAHILKSGRHPESTAQKHRKVTF